MKSKKPLYTIALTLLILSISLINIVYGQEGGFVVSEKVGSWEKITDTELKSSTEAGFSKVVLEYPLAVLGSWQGNIDIQLSGESGDEIRSIFTVEIPELDIQIIYQENYTPGFLGPLGEIRRNRLMIVNQDKKLYDKLEKANWPYDNRLNTRIYYSIYRISDTKITLVVEDFFGKINKNYSIYWSGNLTYTGEPVTLRITVEKESSKPSSLSSTLFFNDIIENEIYRETLSIKKLNVDMNILFYSSLGFLIIALTANIFMRMLTKPTKPITPIKKKGIKKKRKNR